MRIVKSVDFIGWFGCSIGHSAFQGTVMSSAVDSDSKLTALFVRLFCGSGMLSRAMQRGRILLSVLLSINYTSVVSLLAFAIPLADRGSQSL
jgi:hypothetical protein